MSSEFLNCSHWCSLHREVRTERVAQDVRASVHKAGSLRCASNMIRDHLRRHQVAVYLAQNTAGSQVTMFAQG